MKAIWDCANGALKVTVDLKRECSRKGPYRCGLPEAYKVERGLKTIPECPGFEYIIKEDEGGFDGGICGLWIKFRSELDEILFG